jgi:hypothetical protein
VALPHLKNYLPSENPFKLADPPDWWLQQLFDYDAQLVVFPSRHRMAYILARRRHYSNAMDEMVQLDKNLIKQTAGLDGDILANNNLIYVRHLIGEAVRRPQTFQWLRDNDITANGGAERVANRFENAEADIAAQKRRTMIDDIDHRARDAWRSYQARTGRRSGAGKTRAAAKQMPKAGFTPAESPLAIFTGR